MDSTLSSPPSWNLPAITIDLAKDVFELAFGDRYGRTIKCKHLAQYAFSRPAYSTGSHWGW